MDEYAADEEDARGVEPAYDEDEDDEDDEETGVSETELLLLRWPADGVPAPPAAAAEADEAEADGSGLDAGGIATGVLGYSDGLTVAASCRNLALLRVAFEQKERKSQVSL